jgi:hypothetical protein
MKRSKSIRGSWLIKRRDRVTLSTIGGAGKVPFGGIGEYGCINMRVVIWVKGV